MKPPSPCTGFQHGAGHLLRLDVLLEDALHVVDVQCGAVHLRCERPEAVLVGDDLRGKRHRQVRAAVERMVERDHAGPAGCDAGDLDRVLDRLSAGVDQERARLALSGPELVEELAHHDVRLVHPDHEALVQVAVDLLVQRRRCEPVAGVLAAEPTGEVDVFAAVDVPDARALGARDDERRGGDATGDVPLPLGDDTFGGCPLADRHQACFRSSRISPAARSPVSTAPLR
jgi:hypothetical protein